VTELADGSFGFHVVLEKSELARLVAEAGEVDLPDDYTVQAFVDIPDEESDEEYLHVIVRWR
jgi:hypothetical protein